VRAGGVREVCVECEGEGRGILTGLASFRALNQETEYQFSGTKGSKPSSRANLMKKFL
jgi:hypothetical protein